MNEIVRNTHIKLFYDSTIEGLQSQIDTFLSSGSGRICPANVIRTNLYMHNNVYQYELIYAVVDQKE